MRLAFWLFVVFCMNMIFSCTRQGSSQTTQDIGVQNNSKTYSTQIEPADIVIKNSQKQKNVLRNTASFETEKNQHTTQTETSQKALVTSPNLDSNSETKSEVLDIRNCQIGGLIKQPINRPDNNSNEYIQTKTIELCCDYWIEAGSGINYYTYNQTFNSVSDIKFSKIDTQYIYYKTGFNLVDQIDLNLNYHKSISSVKNGTSIRVDSGNFEHQIMTVTLNYSLRKNNENSWLELILGFNHESLPFVVPTGTNTITTYQIDKTNVISGLQYSKKKNDKTTLYSGFNLNIPLAKELSNSGSYSEENSSSLTASVGAKHKFKPNMYFKSGLSAYYTSQNFSYSTSNSTQSGKQQYFFINFNFGVGYEF